MVNMQAVKNLEESASYMFVNVHCFKRLLSYAATSCFAAEYQQHNSLRNSVVVSEIINTDDLVVA